MNEVIENQVELFEGEPEAVKQADDVTEPEKKVDTPEFVVPDKFQGKGFEDVVDAYTNLEKEFGRKANEVGELRKLTDEILRQQVQQPQAKEQKAEELSADDFYDDPNRAVDTALNNNPRLKQIEQHMIQETQKRTHEELLKKHKDADAVVASPEFQEWAGKSPTRMRMLQEAHQSYDVDMASDLIDVYKSTRKDPVEEAKEVRDAKAAQQLKQATTEKGRANVVTKDYYRRADLIRLKIEDPARYAAMSPDIRKAYSEGRVR